jgi:class 3 adenylate cyclase
MEKQRERKVATMVFADLVGSTELGGSQDPERTRAQMERFYDAMTAEIETAGGTVEKFAGDAVLAVFGVPAALEDHAERALHSAFAMQRRLRELFGDQLALRIGVNTGEVVAGTPRAGSSFVSGDPVNVAARLQQSAEAREILVGERTVAVARGAFEFGPARTIEAKGKPAGVECRSLVRALSLMRPRGVGGLLRAFVGRDDELAALEQVHAEVAAKRAPRLVTVLGDAGVGKTRLVREFWERLAATSPETMRRTGRCLSYGRGITYWPLAEVLKEELGIQEDDPPDTVLARLGSRGILALTLGLDVAHGLHPLTARDRFQDTWIEFLDELVAEQPLVLLVEDLHWADEQLLDLLERLVREVRGPLLLVVTARAELLEQRPGWGARAEGRLHELQALEASDAERLLGDLLGSALPQGLRDVIVERAEGNPFLIEELLATMIDRGLLRSEDGAWRMAALPEDFGVPDTVQAVVAARIDLLEPADKQALQAASVIGRTFWAGPLYELVADAEPDLDVLEARDFIRRRAGSSMSGEREYAIKHALTREVAYASLPRGKRARLHAAFARWLERAAEGGDEQAALLAHHYSSAVAPEDADLAWADDELEYAELRERALRWLHRTAELAIGRFEIDEGLALLHRALELEPEAAERVTLWRAIGRANVLKFDGDAFFAAMLNALEGSDRTTTADTYSELGFQTFSRASMWKHRPDREMLRKWVDRALELAEADSPARAKALIARTTLLTLDDANTAVHEANELVDRLDDQELRIWVWDARRTAALMRDDFEEAFVWASSQVEFAPRLTDLDHASLIYLYAFVPYVATGRLEEARALTRAHEQVTATLSAHHRLHAASLLIEAERVVGRWDAVAELTERAEDAVAANAATPCALNANSLLACALAAAIRGDDRESRRLEEAANEHGVEGYGLFLDPFRVELALARGDLAEVETRLRDWTFPIRDRLDSLISHLNALVALDRRQEIEQESPRLIRPGTYIEPFALRALGFARGDNELIGQAIDRFEAMSLEWHAAQTQRLLADES